MQSACGPQWQRTNSVTAGTGTHNKVTRPLCNRLSVWPCHRGCGKLWEQEAEREHQDEDGLRIWCSFWRICWVALHHWSLTKMLGSLVSPDFACKAAQIGILYLTHFHPFTWLQTKGKCLLGLNLQELCLSLGKCGKGHPLPILYPFFSLQPSASDLQTPWTCVEFPSLARRAFHIDLVANKHVLNL